MSVGGGALLMPNLSKTSFSSALKSSPALARLSMSAARAVRSASLSFFASAGRFLGM